MSKSRIVQASAVFFNEGIVNYTSVSLSTCFEAEKFEHTCSIKASGHSSRKFVNNAVPKKVRLFPFGEIHDAMYTVGETVDKRQ